VALAGAGVMTGGDVVEEELPMRQEAPYPRALADLVARLEYRPGWKFWLGHFDRGQGSKGLTLDVITLGYNTYRPQDGQTYRVHHYFPVPPAAFNAASWQRWLFDRLLEVERHEAMEFFAVGCATRSADCLECAEHPSACHERHRLSEPAAMITLAHQYGACEQNRRPYAPNHGHGEDPYIVHDLTTGEARRTSFRNVLDDDGTGRSKAPEEAR